jgi:hypothetical protein
VCAEPLSRIHPSRIEGDRRASLGRHDKRVDFAIS